MKKFLSLLLSAIMTLSVSINVFAYDADKPYIKISDSTGIVTKLNGNELKKVTEYEANWGDILDIDGFSGYTLYLPKEYVTKAELVSLLKDKAAVYNPKFDFSVYDKASKDNSPIKFDEAIHMIGAVFSNMPEPKGGQKAILADEKSYCVNNLPKDADFQRLIKFGIMPELDPEYRYFNDEAIEESGKTYEEYRKSLDMPLVDYKEIANMLPSEAFIDSILAGVYRLYSSNPKDDFFSYINSNYIKSAKLKTDFNDAVSKSVFEDSLDDFNITDYYKARLVDLDNSNTEAAEKIVKDIVSGSGYEQGSMQQKIKDYYDSKLNTAARKKIGNTPIQYYLDGIDNAKTTDELLAFCTKYSKDEGFPYFGFSTTHNPDDYSQKVLVIHPIDIYQSGTTFYSTMLQRVTDNSLRAELKEQYKSYLDICREYYTRLFILGGDSETEAAKEAEILISAAKKIAEKDDFYSVFSGYSTSLQSLETAQVQKYFNGVDISKIAKLQGYSVGNRIYVLNYEQLKVLGSYCDGNHLNELKVIAKYAQLSNSGDYLSPEYTALDKEMEKKFQQHTELVNKRLGISGLAVTEPSTEITTAYNAEKEAITEVMDIFNDYIDRIYCEKYLSQDTVNYVTNLTNEIISAYRTRIQNADWLIDDTKAAAIKKLDNIKIIIGQNRTGSIYLDNINISNTDESGYYDNIVSILNAQQSEDAAKQNEMFNADDVTTELYMGNAGYIPALNTIIIPAGILQSPVFDINASKETNLGGIGVVIGHEISHAFDRNGANLDENGNVKDWWNRNDKSNFQRKCKAVAAHYANYVYSNASIYSTVDEDVSDLGALACTLDIMKTIDNADYKAYFESYAKLFADVGCREFLESATSSHSFGITRVNCSVQNFNEFYKTYGITDKDAMYVPEDKRVSVW